MILPHSNDKAGEDGTILQWLLFTSLYNDIEYSDEHKTVNLQGYQQIHQPTVNQSNLSLSNRDAWRLHPTEPVPDHVSAENKYIHCLMNKYITGHRDFRQAEHIHI